MIFSKDYKEFEKHVLMLRNEPHFIKDEEKMSDFFYLSKEEFLSSYSYLTEEEYDNTKELFKYLYEAGFIKVKVVNAFDFKEFKNWVMSNL